MLADFFTKPLQGTPFRQFRDAIMNSDPASNADADHRSVLEHRDKPTVDRVDNSETAMTQHHVDVQCKCSNDFSDSKRHDDGWTLVSNKQIRKSQANGHFTIRQDHHS